MESLMAAARAGDVDGMYKLIQQAPDILDHIGENSFVHTPLHIAASAGHTRFALEILSLKPSFGRMLNQDGLSPLHLALQNGHSETARRLVNFEKELVRVKARGWITPLHFIAERGDCVDLLAEFLCACPQSIQDRTVGDETAVHIAVKNLNLSAFKVLLGWLIRRMNNGWVVNCRDENGNTVLHTAVATSQPQIVKSLVQLGGMKINEKNSEGNTALDIAERVGPGDAQTTILKILHGAGASKSSSLGKESSLADFLKSPQRFLEVIFVYNFYMRREISAKTRDAVLVVASLIATATFQAVISPPSGGGDTSLTQGVLFKAPNGSEVTYKALFLVFYTFNTISFIASVTMIIVVLPFRDFPALHATLIFLTMSYGISFFLISPSFWYALAFMLASLASGILVYFMKFVPITIEDMYESDTKPYVLSYVLMSHSQRIRLRMLQRLVMN